MIFLSAFVLYFSTSAILIANESTGYFGADSEVYLNLAYGQIEPQAELFHPFTILIAHGWMSIFAPLKSFMSPGEILAAMFAAIGAAGVAAAHAAFRGIAQRSLVLPATLVYALSLSVWYFSSIHETKIIDAAIASIYIAIYIHLRNNWSLKGAVWLTIVLIIGCMNAIVAAFLVTIPAIDTFLKHKYNIFKLKWVVLHALPAPLIFLALELFINYSVQTRGLEAEGNSHLDLLITFAKLGDHSLESFYGFILNWFIFSLAAPSQYANHTYQIWPDYEGYFYPAITTYFSHIAQALFIIAFAVILLLIIFSKKKISDNNNIHYLLIGLGLYSAERIVLFFIFIPSEALLYSSPTVLAHLIIITALLSRCAVRMKLLAFHYCAAMLAISNIRFIFG